MFSHVMVGANDIDRSKSFYDALFEHDGARVDDKGRLVYRNNGAVFMVTQPIDGAAGAPRQRRHRSASTIDSPEQVDAWHDAGVEAGGTASEDPPG